MRGPIHKPHKRLGSSIVLQFVQKLISGHGKSEIQADINVTPLVDMLTMLVIFLLMTFSATGDILFMSKDIVLPKAYNSVELQRSPIISVSAQAIVFEGALVMNTGEANPRNYPDWKLTPLYTMLEETKQRILDKGKKFDEAAQQVIIQSDSNVPFEVIKMLMRTCGVSGFTGVNFAVVQWGRSLSAP
jgi:biopolymer transport protein ExbD